MNDMDKWMRIPVILVIFASLCALIGQQSDAYMVNKARIRHDFTTTTTIKHVYPSIQTLVKQVRNTDCREAGSAGVQAGCIIERNKILLLLGEDIDLISARPRILNPNSANMFCYKDLGGYTEYGPGYGIYILKNNNEIPLNRTIYPQGIRIYDKKGTLNRSISTETT